MCARVWGRGGINHKAFAAVLICRCAGVESTQCLCPFIKITCRSASEIPLCDREGGRFTELSQRRPL